MLGRTLRVVLGVVIVILVVVLLAALLRGGDEKAKPKTITTKVDTADKGKIPDKKIVAPAPVVATTKSELEDKGAKDETPPGVPPPVIEAGRQQQDDLAIKDLLPIGVPLAAPSVPGCLSRFLARNYSSRRGVAPRLWVIHWSGGPNRAGWEDVNGLTAFGNNPRAGVSWHFNIDREGHCHYNVNVINKAWTEAGFNPTSISVEIINVGGRDKPLLTGRGLRVLGGVIAYTARRFHIPLQQGATAGCKVVRGGIVDHNSLGPCGGGHPDVGDNSLAPIIAATKAAYARQSPKRITATDRATCRKLNYWRTHGRRAAGRANAVRRKAALTRRGVTCSRKGPSR